MIYRDLEKEFTSKHGHITITREDYESQTIPMIAEEMSDEKMQAIVDDINLAMKQDYDEEQLGWLQKYRGDGKGLTKEQLRFADKMSERECEYFERCATDNGMRYWEDLDEDEEATLRFKIDNLSEEEYATHTANACALTIEQFNKLRDKMIRVLYLYENPFEENDPREMSTAKWLREIDNGSGEMIDLGTLQAKLNSDEIDTVNGFVRIVSEREIAQATAELLEEEISEEDF